MKTTMVDTRSVVIDSGSGTTSAGFEGGDEPKVVFPTMVGQELENKRGILLAEKLRAIGLSNTERRKWTSLETCSAFLQ